MFLTLHIRITNYQVVSVMDSQSGGPGFSNHYLDCNLVALSSNPRPHL